MITHPSLTALIHISTEAAIGGVCVATVAHTPIASL